MDKVVISCITPTFNRANLLKRAIESTIAQIYPFWEMIIVDDGSTDNTEEMVLEYVKKDPRIKYFKNPSKGGNAARNYGIKQAKGEWIAFLDDDVENLPDRFEKQLNAVLKSGVDFILSGFIAVGLNGTEKIVNNGLWAKGAGITSRWFIKKELLFKAGLFDEDMPAMQENELSYRIAEFETFANHLEVVTREYSTSGSVSKGRNGLLGSDLLIKKHENKMQPIEAAWWYYKIGKSYLNFGERDKANEYFKLGLKKDTRLWIKIFIPFYIILFSKIKINLFRKVLNKLYSKLDDRYFPKIVNHKVIK